MTNAISNISSTKTIAEQLFNALHNPVVRRTKRAITAASNKKPAIYNAKKISGIANLNSELKNTLDPIYTNKEVYGDAITKIRAGRISEYNIIEEIGKGAHAIVKSGVHKSTGRKVAIKIYEKHRIADYQHKTCVDREIRIMKRIKHGNIVELYETIDTTRQLYIIMELIKGESLYSYTRKKEGRKLEERECMRLFTQIVSGINYCHKQNIVHRDIKMENLLLDDKRNAKIIDFGFSICAVSSQKLKIFCGTPSYMAPEIVMKKEYYGPPADVWSLGILLFTMLCGRFPFRGSTEHDLFRSISRCQYTFPTHISSVSKTIINSMLRLKPEHRATSEQLYNQLIHHTQSTLPLQISEHTIEQQLEKEHDKEIIEKIVQMGYMYPRIAKEMKEQKGPVFDTYLRLIKNQSNLQIYS